MDDIGTEKARNSSSQRGGCVTLSSCCDFSHFSHSSLCSFCRKVTACFFSSSLALPLRFLVSCRLHQCRYDGVDAFTGEVRWQSRLNECGLPFFRACDGFFTDYHWKENFPALSRDFALSQIDGSSVSPQIQHRRHEMYAWEREFANERGALTHSFPHCEDIHFVMP